MAGVAGRSGGKPLPFEVHVARGTYRPDRHAPKPANEAKPASPAVRRRVLRGLGAAGRHLVTEMFDTYGDWSPRDLALLRRAGEAEDRLQALAAQIAKDGAVVDGAEHPLLRAVLAEQRGLVGLFRAMNVER